MPPKRKRGGRARGRGGRGGNRGGRGHGTPRLDRQHLEVKLLVPPDFLLTLASTSATSLTPPDQEVEQPTSSETATESQLNVAARTQGAAPASSPLFPKTPHSEGLYQLYFDADTPMTDATMNGASATSSVPGTMDSVDGTDLRCGVCAAVADQGSLR